MATPVRDEQQPVAPEELLLGPRRPRRLPRWFSVLALTLALLIVAAAAVWRYWPQPVAPLSLAELQDTYAGMVRADGTNDASVLTRQTVAEIPITVSPAECAPLVEQTLANRFPSAALDGVGTYWLGQGTTISLFTMRFADADAAAAERALIAAALDACAGSYIVVRRTQETTGGWQGRVERSVAGSGADDQLGFLLSEPYDVMAIQLLSYLNTLTWQFRYESGSATYSPLGADRLMYSLHAQLDSIVANRP
jgi:hypothetical protein